MLHFEISGLVKAQLQRAVRNNRILLGWVRRGRSDASAVDKKTHGVAVPSRGNMVSPPRCRSAEIAIYGPTHPALWNAVIGKNQRPFLAASINLELHLRRARLTKQNHHGMGVFLRCSPGFQGDGMLAVELEGGKPNKVIGAVELQCELRLRNRTFIVMSVAGDSVVEPWPEYRG